VGIIGEWLFHATDYETAMRIKNVIILLSGLFLGAWFKSFVVYVISKRSRIDPKLDNVDFLVIEYGGQKRFIWNPRRFLDFYLNIYIALLHFTGVKRGSAINIGSRLISWTFLYLFVIITIYGLLLTFHIRLK
jgi:hypothetical protein